VDRAQLLTLTALEITVPVGGLRVRRQTDGISSKVKFAPDSPQEGSGFELPVPRCALIAKSAALVRAA